MSESLRTPGSGGPGSFTSARPPSSHLARSNLKATQRLQAAPELRDRALLVRMDATNSGQVFNVDGDEFGLGRHPQNQACLDDEGISRYHAKVARRGPSFWLEDLNSSNGTYLNGRRISACEIANGDTLQLGPRVSFRFSVASEHEEKVLRQLYESSVRDPMTGAYNRQYFANRLSAELAYAMRHHSELSMVILDIDFFKKTNDTYGHLAGDAVLKTVTDILQRQLRTEDLLARYGGEEFVVLLRGIPLPGAAMAAERLRSAVARTPIVYENVTIPTTISLGCASVDSLEAPSADALVAAADRRLYAAKHSGRNRVVSEG